MRHLGYILVGAMLVFVALLCVLALVICVVAMFEYPESYWRGVTVASAAVGCWKIGDLFYSQAKSLFGLDTAVRAVATTFDERRTT
jgi:hypothetical protein